MRLTGSQLIFLAYVDPSDIPLHLIQGPSLAVSIDNDSTKKWLDHALLEEEVLRRQHASQADDDCLDFVVWHATHAAQSRVAVLARPTDHPPRAGRVPRITEVLIYAEKVTLGKSRGPITPPYISEGQQETSLVDEDNDSSLNTENIRFSALLLSSDAIYHPLPSLEPLAPGEAKFLDSADGVEEQTTKKRRADLFDEASDRRKHLRCRSGHSVSVVTSRVSERDTKTLNSAFSCQKIKQEPEDTHKPETSKSLEQAKTLGSGRSGPEVSQSQHRQSVTSSTSAKLPSDSRSNNTVVAGIAQSFRDDSYEAKNKQTVSRIVMAGMRLYGLQQRKSQTTSQKRSQKTSSDADGEKPQRLDITEQDLEYRAVYHQTYKGTLFAFVSDYILQ